MVYNDLDYLGKNEEEDGEEGQAPVAPVTSGQPGAVNSAAPQNQQQSQPERKGSGKFTNIKKYVDANQGGGQKLGQGIQQKIGSEADKVREGIQSAQGQFQQGAQQTNQTLNKATGYAQQVGQAGGAQQIADVEPEFKTFRDIYTGQVKGPDETISSQQQNAAKLQALSQLAGNESGRFQLLDETYTNPAQAYTRGQKRFDQLLLQATPDVTKDLQKFGETQSADVQGKYTQTEKAQQAEVQRLKDLGLTQQEALKQASGEYKPVTDEEGNVISQGSGALGGVYSELTAAQQAAKTKQDADVENVREALSNFRSVNTESAGPSGSLQKVGKPAIQAGRYLTEDQVNLLNLDPNLRTYGLDMGQFAQDLGASDTNITQADVANDEQTKRLNALYKLTGQDPSSINLGEKEGRLGAKFGQSFEDARNAQEEHFLNDNIKNLLGDYVYDTDFTGNHTQAKNLGQLINQQSSYYTNGNLVKNLQSNFDPAISELRTALSSNNDPESKEYLKALANAFESNASAMNVIPNYRQSQFGDFVDFGQRARGTATALDSLYSGNESKNPGIKQLTDSLGVTDIGSFEVANMKDSGRTFTDRLMELLNSSKETITGYK
jgi:hypothetical protein